MMYKVRDKANRLIDYLRLAPHGGQDLHGLHQPLERPGHQRTTGWSARRGHQRRLPLGPVGHDALFYDFVQKTDPTDFSAWAARNQLPTNVRILSLDQSPGFAPKTQAFQGSDQIAQYIASNTGMWSIGYDEFSFAINYKATTARIQNASGAYTLPYAQNISSALEGPPQPGPQPGAVRRLQQREARRLPISAYSYIVTQCARPPTDRRARALLNGVSETPLEVASLHRLRGPDPDGQHRYSPLPPNLSQEVANAIGRMVGARLSSGRRTTARTPVQGPSTGRAPGPDPQANGGTRPTGGDNSVTPPPRPRPPARPRPPPVPRAR
jgi:phosphate transport system substrate-binding protein